MNNKGQDAGMSVWVIVLLIAAVGMWFWSRLDEQSRKAADAAARRALDAAEKAARDASRAAQSTLQDVQEKVAERVEPIQIRVEMALDELQERAEDLLENLQERADDVLEDAQEATLDAAAPVLREVQPLDAESDSAADSALAPLPAEAELLAAVPAEVEMIAATPAEPARVDAPEVGDVVSDDDLTRLEGIGPKFRDVLVSAGIRTFAELAQTSEDRLTEIIRAAGARRPGSLSTWAEQARYAAQGDWEALAAYQQTLNGGRKAE